MERINTFNLPNYDLELDLCVKLINHRDGDGNRKYVDQLQKISNRQSEHLQIFLDDAVSVADKDFPLRIEENVLRYISLFYEAADKVMPRPDIEIADKTRSDVFLSSRLRMMALDLNLLGDERRKLPNDLTRRYEIVLVPRSSSKIFSVREVKSEQIGKLISISGIATRITNVRPLLFVATYTCDACGHEFYKSIRSREFMPMLICENKNCLSAEKMHLQTRGSRFLKYQQLTIQEIPSTVPFGGIPRTMSINLRSKCVRKCVSGDTVTISGVFLPMQYTGYKQMKSGLTSATSFEGFSIKKHKKSFSKQFDSERKNSAVLKEIKEMAGQPDCYSKLARSIAPEIYGLVDVKKALLLLLVGGATKKMEDGMSIRGDINILLMGDPGVAKSQLLKHIAFIAPRGVYTTGKGSSGVGLTAAVVRDTVTEEMVLEGGALVMADMGVCCIDEFDKMEEGDRTAIHEVMEQQTVSISKAGICTTLNARTSVLAAANPVYGRYDKSKSPEANIVLPAALMSRFDLLFVLVDSASAKADNDLASHICYVHTNRKAPELGFDPVSPDFLRSYISYARSFEPKVPENVVENIVGVYLQMRSEGRENNSNRFLPTPRTLLSILRLSQAHARLRFSSIIEEKDISEATRLIYTSKDTALTEENNKTEKDNLTAIFSHIKSYLQRKGIKSARVPDLVSSLRIRGFEQNVIQSAIDHYAQLDVWMLNKNGTKLTLL